MDTVEQYVLASDLFFKDRLELVQSTAVSHGLPFFTVRSIVKKDEKMPAAYDAYEIIFPRKKIGISKGIQTIHIIIHLQEFRKK